MIDENALSSSTSSSSSSYPKYSSSIRRSMSTAAAAEAAVVTAEYDNTTTYDIVRPEGELFESKLKHGAIGENLIGKTASIRRVFGPRSNAQGLLTCGGEDLARHASFDPDYETAKDWIRSRAIGPAVLSPILISGLVGALVEAALPQTVGISSSLEYLRPLIVGVEVCARIKVQSVRETQRAGTVTAGSATATTTATTTTNNSHSVDSGYEISLSTEVVRMQDDAVIAEGTHKVWIPSYLTMM
jgi:acyl dehydratase